jgi:predicted negative regulator of RcsB-dependent stress response
MSSEKSKELKLKGPDAFQVKVGDFLAGIAQNPKPLFAVIALLLGALAAGYGIRYFIAHKEETRRSELSKVDAVYEDELKNYNKQREALEKQRDTLKAAQPKPAADAKDAKPVEETPEIKALNQKITDLKPDHATSSEQYKSYFEGHKTTAEGWVAGLRYAAYAAEQNKLEDAQKVLEEVTKNAKSHPILQTQGLMMLISIQTDRGELDKALESTETLLNVVGDGLKPRALLTKAQIQYLKKDYANTRATATEVLTKHENSPEADRARSLVALLPE